MNEYIDIPVFTGDIGNMPENLQAIAKQEGLEISREHSYVLTRGLLGIEETSEAELGELQMAALIKSVLSATAKYKDPLIALEVSAEIWRGKGES